MHRSDMSTFFEDIKVARPTSMMIIPRIANMLYDQAQEHIRKAKGANKQVRAPQELERVVSYSETDQYHQCVLHHQDQRTDLR